MTNTDLTAWLTRFQAELRDDITNGARIDSTRKPGFYYIRETVTCELPEEDTPDAEGLFWRMKRDDKLLALLAFHADREEHGLVMQCVEAYSTSYCECEPWDFMTIQDAMNEIATNMRYEVQESICIADEDEFYAWASSLPELEHLFYEEHRKHRLDHVFLTRKSGERHARRYEHRYNQPTVFAHHVDESNPDLLNAIRFLAALDLEKSRLVLNQEQK